MGRNKYRVPKSVYYQCIWLIKDMDRLRRLEAAADYKKSEDEFVFFIDDDDVINDEGVLHQAKWKLECIRSAVHQLPEEYRKQTLDSILYGISYDDTAHENTWRRWRQIFIRELAQNLLLI